MKNVIYVGSWGGAHSGANTSREKMPSGVNSFVIENDELKFINLVDCENASELCIKNDKSVLYAANECRNFYREIVGSGGGVTSFNINKNGSLSLLNSSIAYGPTTTSVSLNSKEDYLVCANHGSHTSKTCHYELNKDGKYELKIDYDDSSLVSFKLKENGEIGEIVDLIKFYDRGYYLYKGQSQSHLHHVYISKNNYVYSCNRGADSIEVLKLNNGKFDLLESYKTPKGMAPRHLTINNNEDKLYVCYENYPYMGVFSIMKNGKLKEEQFLQTQSNEYIKEHPLFERKGDTCSLDEEFKIMSSSMPVDVHLSKDNEYLYIANRFPGTIARYKVKESGLVELIDITKLSEDNIRGFALTNDDKHLVCGYIDKNYIELRKINNGKISEAISTAKCGSPVGMLSIELED